MLTPPLFGTVEFCIDAAEYIQLLAAFPMLKTPTGTALPNRELVISAFKVAGYSYTIGSLKHATKLIRTILNSQDVPEKIVCASVLFDAQIAIDTNHYTYASSIVRRLVELPQWMKATDRLRNRFTILNQRLTMKQDSARCSKLWFKKQTDIEWLALRMEDGFRDGSFGVVIKALFALRRSVTPTQRVEIDIAIGDAFFLGIQNLDVAEMYYASAIEACMSPEFSGIVFPRPITRVYYELGSVMLCNNMYAAAFYALLIGLSTAADSPEAWMRLAQTAILVTNAQDAVCRDTPGHTKLFREAFDHHCEDEVQRTLANELIKCEFFRRVYDERCIKPEPTYAFAFNCIQRACQIVEKQTSNFAHLQVDLISMFIFLSLEMGMSQQALDGLANIFRLPNATMGQQNIALTYKAKACLNLGKAPEALVAINSIEYPADSVKRWSFPRGKGHLYEREVDWIDSCYYEAFQFTPIDAMRLKFLYNVRKCRREVLDLLNEKNLQCAIKQRPDLTAAIH